MIRNKEIQRFILSLFILCGCFTMVCFFIDPLAGIISIISLIAPLSVFFLFTRNRYRDISELSEKLNQIANGDLSLDVRDNEEGELSILRNEIYKVTSRLKEQADILKEEKETLANNLSDISHQLKTPLASLQIMSELFERNDLPQNKREEFYKNMQIELSRMEWLVLSLLKIAKLDADVVVLQRKMIPAKDVIEMSIQTLHTILTSKKQTIRMTGGEQIHLLCDVNWTVEALANLIKNASEYSPENGEIFISWGENPLAIFFIIKDSGSGIDKRDFPHIFQRFYRGKKASKESVGIGLPLALEIMRRQNGDIEIRNEVGKGAMFIVKFYKNEKFI